MPDPISLLEQDHRKVEALFADWQRTKDAAIAEQICTELTIHATVEEQAVYPVLAQDVPKGEELEEEAEQEHGEAKDLIAKIQAAGYAGPQVANFMEELISGVNHHVEEEEGEIFPKMRESIPKDKLEAIGASVQQLKTEQLAAVRGGTSASAAATSAPTGSATRDQLIDLTKDELYRIAQEKGVEGRSNMDKDQLIKALSQR
jgi:hemerythrin superfamily protein